VTFYHISSITLLLFSIVFYCHIQPLACSLLLLCLFCHFGLYTQTVTLCLSQSTFLVEHLSDHWFYLNSSVVPALSALKWNDLFVLLVTPLLIHIGRML